MKESEFVNRIFEKYIKDEELKRLLIIHSSHVAQKALQIAADCGLEDRIDRQFVWDAAMLHDIGVVECNAPAIHCHGPLPYIQHGVAGAAILKKEGLDTKYCRVCERHTGSGITAAEIRENGTDLPEKDYLPETLEEKLICFSDKFFSKSSHPDEEKSMERIRKSMQKFGNGAVERFENLAAAFSSKKP